jgi:hypothetical protein
LEERTSIAGAAEAALSSSSLQATNARPEATARPSTERLEKEFIIELSPSVGLTAVHLKRFRRETGSPSSIAMGFATRLLTRNRHTKDPRENQQGPGR